MRYVWLGLLALLLLVLFWPIKGRVDIDDGEIFVTFRWLFFKLFQLPAKPGKKKKKQKAEDSKEDTPAEGEKKKRTLPDLGTVKVILKSVFAGLHFLTRHIHLRRFTATMTVGTDDPHKTAIRFGQVAGGGYALLGVVANIFDTKFESVDFYPDFENAGISYKLGFSIWALPVIIVITAAIAAKRFLKERTALQKDKGGAKQDE